MPDGAEAAGDRLWHCALIGAVHSGGVRRLCLARSLPPASDDAKPNLSFRHPAVLEPPTRRCLQTRCSTSDRDVPPQAGRLPDLARPAALELKDHPLRPRFADALRAESARRAPMSPAVPVLATARSTSSTPRTTWPAERHRARTMAAHVALKWRWKTSFRRDQRRIVLAAPIHPPPPPTPPGLGCRPFLHRLLALLHGATSAVRGASYSGTPDGRHLLRVIGLRTCGWRGSPRRPPSAPAVAGPQGRFVPK